MFLFNKTLHQSYFVVFMCAGVIAGTVLALIFRIGCFSSFVWAICAGALMIFVYFCPKMIFVILALVAGMLLAFVRSSTELFDEDYIQQFYEQVVEVTGIIDGDPETDDSGTKFKLKNLELGENREYKVSGTLYISEYKNEKLARGDNLTIKGKLREGFGVYAGYMYKPGIKKWERPEPGDLVLKIRNWFSERIEKMIPEPQVKLGMSYLLGMKSGLPEDLDENLRMVGLVHIVVASGAHLSILVEIARKIFGKISRFAGLLFSILFVVFFMAMVGWTPSIMRAGIMAILTLVTWYVGRKIAPWRMILLVASVTLLIDPMFIINLGWLLSFTSFAGIMILGPKIKKLFYGEKKPGFIAETIITTISATIMTLPIILYFYGMVSLISVIANLLILPTLSFAMGLVFLTGVVVGVSGVENIVAFLATRLLDFHIMVVDFFGGIKSFMVKIEPYQAWVFGIYLIILAPLLIRLLWKKMVKLREEVY